MDTDIITGSWKTDCGHTYLAFGNGMTYSLRSLPDGSFLRVCDRAGRLLGEYPTHGRHSCHILLMRDKVSVSDYSSGSLTVFHLDSYGMPSGDPDVHCFGEGSRIHSSWLSPSDGLLIVVDHGRDCIYRFDPENPCFPHCGYDSFSLPANSAPRHCAFNAGGDRLYVSTEYSDEVFVMEYPSMRLLQRCVVNPAHPRGGAHVAVSPDGASVYVSSRFSNDGIAVFRTGKGGLLEQVGYTVTGSNPRHFSFSPDGTMLAVACKDSDRVELYRIDRRTGLLPQMVDSVPVEKPVFVTFP